MKLNVDVLLRRPDTVVALVGATEDRSKYGSIIFQDLIAKGYNVWPVNRDRATVHGVEAYRNLAALPGPPTIVNVVVPPRETMRVLDEAEALGIQNIWLQPGAESPEVLERLESGPFDYLAHACIMVRARTVI
jgi:predicted CoA-binding protein